MIWVGMMRIIKDARTSGGGRISRTSVRGRKGTDSAAPRLRAPRGYEVQTTMIYTHADSGFDSYYRSLGGRCE